MKAAVGDRRNFALNLRKLEYEPVGASVDWLKANWDDNARRDRSVTVDGRLINVRIGRGCPALVGK